MDYNIILKTLCLSICVYNYEEYGIDTNRLINSFENQTIVDDILENYKKLEIIKCYKNSKGLKSILCIDHKDNQLILAIKGSDQINDILNDIKTLKIRLFENDDSSIHSGFSEIFVDNLINELILKDILEILKNYENYKLYITGHSLGGALSILFSYYLSKNINQDINVITYGSPKIGDFKFYENFNKVKNIKLTRIINDNDIIVSFPKINYYHVGDFIELNEVNVKYYKNEETNYYTYSIFKKYSLNDHFCKNYYINIINNRLKFLF